MSIVSSATLSLTQGAVSSASSPVTFAIWTYITSVPGSDGIINLSGASGFSSMYVKNNTKLLAMQSGAGSNAEADSSVGVTLSAWQLLVGIVTSATSRTCYINGSSSGTNSTSISSGTMTSTNVGGFVGIFAYPAIWNLALTTNDISNLYNAGAGSDPRYTKPANLVSFTPFQNSSYLDVVSGNTWTIAAGSPSFSTDPFALSNWPANPPVFF